jgi:hypothetical protein
MIAINQCDQRFDRRCVGQVAINSTQGQNRGLGAAIRLCMPVMNEADLKIHGRTPEHIGLGSISRDLRKKTFMQRRTEAIAKINLDVWMAPAETIEQRCTMLLECGGIDDQPVLGGRLIGSEWEPHGIIMPAIREKSMRIARARYRRWNSCRDDELAFDASNAAQ